MTSVTSPAGVGSRRPHVLTLVDYLSAGGAENFARNVATHLDPSAYRRTFCATRAQPDPDDERRVRAELDGAGVEVLTLRRQGRVDLSPWVKLVRFMRAERVDILHTHKFGSNVWGSLLRGPARVPIMIAHEHTWSYEGQPWRRVLDRELIARRSDRFLAVSQLDRQRMIDIEHIDPERVNVVTVGIPDRSASGGDVRAELGIKPADPVLVSVGHLRPQKALEVLLDAAAQLRQSHPHLRVLIAGEGSERPQLEARIRAQGLEHTVSLLGRRHDVMDVLEAADVTVCCSDFEGTPLAVLEYMAAAKPVVATRVGGLPDIVRDGFNGLLVNPRAPSELADRVEELLGDPGLRRRLGDNARQLQQAEFTFQVTLRHIEQIYAELLSGPGLGRTGRRNHSSAQVPHAANR
jgi:glycosyltransferase involved in cell wall biosynthesis